MTGMYSHLPFSGSYTALITPFTDAGAFDKAAFESLVDWQINEGINGVVPTGTTGESPTLSHEEHDQVIEICVQVTAGRVPVIAGTGSNNTSEAIKLSQHAEKVGADAVIIVSPYYNKPTQTGLKAHFLAIADSISIPVIIYDIPGRSIVQLDDMVLTDLAAHRNIIGIKDCTSDCARPAKLHRLIGDHFCQLSGEDAMTLPYLAAGGHGSISVVSNVVPALCSQLHKIWAVDKDYAQAFALYKQLMPLYEALFCESSPGPVKYAAHLLGIAGPTTRLPLTEISDVSKQTVKKALMDLDLLG